MFFSSFVSFHPPSQQEQEKSYYVVFLKFLPSFSKIRQRRANVLEAIAREIVIQEKLANYDNRVDETFARRRLSLWIKNY